MLQFTSNTYTMSNESPTACFSFYVNFYSIYTTFSHIYRKCVISLTKKMNIGPEKSLMSGLLCKKYKISKNNKCANFKLSDTCSLGMQSS